MSQLLELLEQPTVQCLGLALLHFVWQGAVVVVGLVCANRMLRRKSANARYVVSVAALALMTCLPVITFFLVETPQVTEEAHNPVAIAETSSLESGPLSAVAELHGPLELPEHAVVEDAGESPELALAPIGAAPTHKEVVSAERPGADRASSEDWRRVVISSLPWVVGFWVAGVALLSLRLAGSWRQVLRLRSQGTKAVNGSLQATVERLSEQLGIRRSVQVVESTLAAVPCAVGYLRPMILLPVSALMGLSTEQLESILAHELAHIRRHDYLVTVAQAVVETLLFYHPAVWWVSHCIRVERENCCDDLAVSVVKSRLLYAQSLADMAQMIVKQNQLTAAATGANVATRIRRVLGIVPDTSRRPTWWTGVLLLVFLACGAALVSLESAVRPVQAEEVETADGEKESGSETGDREFRLFDGFDGRLALDWEIIRPDASHVSLEKNPGKLTIGTQFGGLHSDEGDATPDPPCNNVYMIPNPTGGDGDFVVTVCLDDFHPEELYQQAGPHIYNDDGNYLKLAIEYNRSGKGICDSWETRSNYERSRQVATGADWDRV